MKLAWSEYLRLQIERPLLERVPWFMLLSLFLLPMSILWSIFASLRAGSRNKAPMPKDEIEPWIISVGNVSVGGTGKSPIVRALSRMALNEGYDVAILTRGVGKNISNLNTIFSIQSQMHSTPQEILLQLSDETLEHFFRLRSVLLPGSTLWLGQGRKRGQLLDELLKLRDSVSGPLDPQRGKQRRLVVIVDDGLQQVSLPVHRDVVVWDPNSASTAPKFCLPFGPYRMGWPFFRPWASSIPRADVIVWSRYGADSDLKSFERSVQIAKRRIFGDQTPHLTSPTSTAAQRETLFEVRARERLQLVRVLNGSTSGCFDLMEASSKDLSLEVSLLAGIARPDRFLKSFEKFFSDSNHIPSIKQKIFLSDHGSFEFKSDGVLAQNTSVVTTLKDVCRWWNVPEVADLIAQERLFALCLETELESVNDEVEADSFHQLFQLEGIERK